MSRRWFVALAGVLLLPAVLAGCGGSSKSVAPHVPSGTLADVRAMVKRTRVPGTVLPPNADTTASLIAFMNVSGTSGVSAVFVSGSSFADAGTVTVRTHPLGSGVVEVALDRASLSYEGSLQYAYTTLVSHPLGLALLDDGIAYERVTVGGNSAWPAFADSVRSVVLPQLGAPGIGSNNVRSLDLQVAWSDPGADSTVYVICAITSEVDSTATVTGTLGRDTAGGAIISYRQLVPLPAGGATLAVTRYRLVYHAVGGHSVGIASTGTTLRHIILS